MKKLLIILLVTTIPNQIGQTIESLSPEINSTDFLHLSSWFKLSEETKKKL